MDQMNKAYEKMRMLVGMEVDEPQTASLQESNSFSQSLVDDFNRDCTLSTKQVPPYLLLLLFLN